MVPVVVTGVVSVAAGVGLQRMAWPVKVKGSEGPNQTRRNFGSHLNNFISDS